MSAIEAEVTIYLPDDISAEIYISHIQNILSQINGLSTQINVIENDNPISNSPIYLAQLKDTLDERIRNPG